MTALEIISFIKSNKTFIEQNYAVKSIGVFGYYVKGDANESSDIDVLVDLAEPKYQYLFGIKSFLEKHLNKKVDVTRRGNHLRESFLTPIEKEIIYS